MPLPAECWIRYRGPAPPAGGVRQEPANHIELMIAGPDLGPLLPPHPLVLLLHDLSVVLQDVGQALAGQHFSPQVIRLDPALIGRVSGAVVPSPVEGQEPRGLAGQVGAEAHLALIDREVGYAAPEFKQRLARVAVALVLLDRIVRRLLGEAVLQLEGENRQAVDEQPDVQGPLRLVAAVAKLPADREAVLLEALLRLHVPG